MSDSSDDDSSQPSAEMGELAKMLLSMKDKPGTFATVGVLVSPLPGLIIDGIGPICLPICSDQAKKIINVARPAPFGLGEKTLVDETIRKSWEIEPARITLENPNFHLKLKTLVSKVKEDLGCDSNHVKSELYKLLLYEEGGHFKPHRDSEKEDGMFATLIVQLPSVFTGNDLIVNHDGKTKTVKFDRKESRYEMVYAAHYADCQHEVTPLTSGYRLALVYNLTWTTPSNPPPNVEKSGNALTKLSSLLKQAAKTCDEVFGWPLEHKYSELSLTNGMAALKGKDRHVVLALNLANKELSPADQFHFYIAKLGRETSEGDDYYEDEELEEDETSIENAFDFIGRQTSLKNISFDVKTQLIGLEEKFRGDVERFWGDYDREEMGEPTGNEGAPCSRWYSNYVVLMMPEQRMFELLCKAGFKEALCQLTDECKKSLPGFKGHFETFLKTFGASSYIDTKEYSKGKTDQREFCSDGSGEKVSSIDRVLKMLTELADPKLTILLISNVLGSKQPYHKDGQVFGLFPSLSLKLFASLLISVPWKEIEETVYDVISHCSTAQLTQWLDLYTHCGILEIANQVIKRSLAVFPQLQNKNEHMFKILQSLADNDRLHSMWWDNVSTFPPLVTNIQCLAYQCSKFSTGTSMCQLLFSCVVERVKVTSKVERGNYGYVLYEAIKPILDDSSYKDKLKELCQGLIVNGNQHIIAQLLIRQPDIRLHKETFNLLLTTYMGWFSLAQFEKCHLQEIIDIARVLSHPDSLSKEEPKHFIAACQRINDPDLLSCVIYEVYSDKNTSTVFIHDLKALLQSLLALLTIKPFIKTSTMSSVLIMMFAKGKDYEDILQQFVSNQFVVNSVDTLGGVLRTLCPKGNKEKHERLKINKSFQDILRNYALHCAIVKPDSQCFSHTLVFLFLNESWSLSSELLPMLLNTDFINKDFICCFKSAVKIKPRNTENYLKLLNVSIDSLANLLETGRILPPKYYNLILEFTKILLSSEFDKLSDKLASLVELKHHDVKSMHASPPSILKQLINDLKSTFGKTNMFRLLLSARAENLRQIQTGGPPKLTWNQPDAVLEGHPAVQKFLRGNQEKFVYQNFNAIKEARRWVELYSGNNPSKGYSFRGETSGSAKNSKAHLRKGREKYDAQLSEYNSLMSELNGLTKQLQALSNKRIQTTDSDNSIPKKIQVISID
eukprot:TCONS_00060315-protein